MKAPLATVAYSVVDKFGVGRVNPVIYITGLALFAAGFSAPVVWHRYRRECQDAWRQHKRISLGVGLASMGTYLLILFAFQLANASYVVAVREVSIVIV